MPNRIALFVDVDALYYCVKRGFSAKLDYAKYLSYVRSLGVIQQSYAYGNYMNPAGVKFEVHLKDLGFNTYFNRIEVDPVTRKRKQKIYWSARMAIDVVNIIDRVDTIVLGTSTPDVLPIIEYAKQKGVSVFIMSAGPHRVLRDNCTQYLEIDSTMLMSKDDTVLPVASVPSEPKEVPPSEATFPERVIIIRDSNDDFETFYEAVCCEFECTDGVTIEKGLVNQDGTIKSEG